MAKIQLTEFNRQKVKNLQQKLNSPVYVLKAIDKIALELTRLLFKSNGY